MNEIQFLMNAKKLLSNPRERIHLATTKTIHVYDFLVSAKDAIESPLKELV